MSLGIRPMVRSAVFGAALLAALLVPAVAAAVGPAGPWQGKMRTPDGGDFDITLVLDGSGSRWNGTLTDPDSGEMTLQNLRVTATRVTFTFRPEGSQIPNFIQWFPLPVWLFIGKVINDPEGSASVIASFIPFFAPILVPTRVALTQVPWVQLLGSALVVYLSAWLFIWVAAKLYRITIMATGQKVSLRQVAHWLRSA